MIITITNNRGGTGKSTTAQTLATGLALKGKKVLLVDIDPQCNTSSTFKVKDSQYTILDVLTNKCTISDAINHKEYIDVIASNINLPSYEKYISIDTNYELTKHKQLKLYLEPIKNNYDYIILDTAPSLSQLTNNAIYTSNYVLIPLLADIYSIEGLANIKNLIDYITSNSDNKDVKISGLLLTHYKAQTIVNKSLRDALYNVAKQLNTKVYKNVIRDSVIFSDSQANNDVCLLRYPTHNASIDYINFINEFLEDMEVN